MDWDTRCGDCGAHFQLDPAGDVAGAACSECGGKRFFMNQPSPTQSDGALRDMVDMDAGGVDRGGNPYGEGMITASMLGDEEPCPICGEIGGCPHGTMRPHGPEEGVNNVALLKGTPGDPMNEGTIVGDDGERQRGFRDNYMHSKIAMPREFYYLDPQHQPDIELHPLDDPRGEDLQQGTLEGFHRWVPPNIEGADPPSDWGMILTDETGARHLDPNAQYEYRILKGQLPQHPEQLPGQLQRQLSEGESAIEGREVRVSMTIWEEIAELSRGLPQDIQHEVTDIALHDGASTALKYLQQFAQPKQRGYPGTAYEMLDNPHFGTQTLSKQVMERTLNMEPYPSLWEIESNFHQSIEIPTEGQLVDLPNGPRPYNSPYYQQALTDWTNRGGNQEEWPSYVEWMKNMAQAQAFGRPLQTPPGGSPAPQKPTGLASVHTAGPLMAIPEALGLGTGAMGMLRGVGLANGISTLMNGVFGNGQQQQPQSGQNTPASAAGQQIPINAFGSTDIPFLLVSDYDTPHSVKSIDEQHDDPENQDQKEFDDGDKSPKNLGNPNNQDTGADGEDGVRDATPGYGFGENSPGIERATMLLPLLLHYFNSDESGENDPLIRAVHEALDKENPGYLDRPEEGGHEVVKMIIQQHGKPHTGGMNAMPGGLPASPMQGTGIQNPGGGTCPSCGGTLAGDGSCPQCGAKQNPQGGALPSPPTGAGMGTLPSAGATGGPSYPPNRVAEVLPPHNTEGWHHWDQTLGDFDYDSGQWRDMHHLGPCPSCHRPAMNEAGICQGCGYQIHGENNNDEAYDPNEGSPGVYADEMYDQVQNSMHPHWGNSQGPVTPEQQQAMMDALQAMGKPELIPDMLQNPEDWGWLLNQIQKQPNSPPLVDPSQMTPPPAPQQGMMNPGGGMPVMDPSQMGGGGGQPMQPMAHILSALVESEIHQPQNAPLGNLPITNAQRGNYLPDESLEFGKSDCPNCHQAGLSKMTGRCDNCGYSIGQDSNDVNLQNYDPMGRGVLEEGEPYMRDDMALDAQQPHWGMVKEAPGNEHMKGVSPKRNRQYEHIKDSLLESGKPVEEAKEEAARTVNKQRAEHSETKEADANNLIPRCPQCKSATTSLLAGVDNDPSISRAKCHSCQNIWDLKTGRTIVALVDFANPTTLPAADQDAPHHDQGHDPGLTWKDKDGNPINEGSTYELHTPGFPIPEEVQVLSKKPEQLELKLVGEFSNIATDPNTPDITISPQEMQERQYSFVPSEAAQNLDNQNNQGNGGMPGMEQIPQSPQTTDEASSSYPNPGTVSQVLASDESTEDLCHRCGGNWVDHIASSPTTTMHECCRCGAAWETKDEWEGREASIDLSWIREDSQDDDFFAGMERARAMQEHGMTSRNLSDIATRGARLQAVRDRLDYNKTAREQHMAGRHFTPSEQRALINERGKARNLEDLDLTGTHYVTRYDPTGKANEYNVPEEHLLLGL